MKKLVRHLLGVFVGISTCGTLLVLYASSSDLRAGPWVSFGAETRRRRDTDRSPEPSSLPLLKGYINFRDHKALQVHCKDCALVTSSGQLIGSGRGAEIDRAECVIRMNDAPTRGYQEDVGRRTSLRVVAHSSIQRLLQKGSELLNASRDPIFIFWGPSSCMRRDGKGRLYNHLQLLHRLRPRLKLHTITRQKMVHFDELFKRETGKDRKASNSWLSTGWFTMIIALELCNRIDVYGMVPPNHCRDPAHRTVPYHYYEPSGIDECTMYISHELGRKGSHHRFITEKHAFARWARQYDVHFHQPEWELESLASNHTERKARRR
ncbi:alpha-N-acetylgalactosaminide alpha-2,6-sialyltransferase 5 isoform X2 [Chiloscyllium plagiosum]|uniref:alpha-N-acetylgalactosaminide alpha-2,6-sialyltransferase 5 isoform X2 n=1 Tax=Chiloscyllium plagiosum TaxID=36176 RepID=UPI001CB81163|nr:alpha-N-acetylgalactosaminide alpha-2,6-sialyltransferase 5 isoform X2 [Chiloscyllium plagiosum]